MGQDLCIDLSDQMKRTALACPVADQSRPNLILNYHTDETLSEC